MQIKFDATEEVAKLIDGYCAEEGLTKKAAINELIHAGWIAKHQDLLAGTLVSDIRKAMTAVAQADKRDREDELDELLMVVTESVDEIRTLVVSSLLANGETMESIEEHYSEAFENLHKD